MPREINFVAERQKGVSKQQKQDLNFARIAGVIFAVVGVAVVATFGVFFYLNNQLGQVKNQEAAIHNQIMVAHDNEVAFLGYAKKLSILTTVYRDRQDKNNIIAYFSSLFGSDAVIVGIDYDQQDKLLHFRVESSDVFSFRRVLNLVNSAELKTTFPTLATSTLVRSDEAKYQITISVPITRIAQST